MSSITFICCSSSSTAQQVASEVESGELWGVNMGTTSKVAAYSNYALVEATETRTLALLDANPDEEKFKIQSSLIDANSFSDAELEWKIWFLRGRL